MQLVCARLHIKDVNIKTFEVLCGFFGLKKSILIWTGSLEDLKALLLLLRIRHGAHLVEGHGVSIATNLKLPGIRKAKHYTSKVLKLQS